MGTKIKFNVADIFLNPNELSSIEMAEFVRCPLFKAVITAYNMCDKNLRIGRIAKDSVKHTVVLSAKNGFPFAHISYNFISNEYTFGRIPDPLNSSDWNDLTTKNVNYLVSKLKPGRNSSLNAYLVDCCSDANACRAIGNLIRGNVDKSVDRYYGSSVVCAPQLYENKWEVDSGLITFLAREHKGETNRTNMPQNLRDKLDTLFAKFVERRTKFDSAIKKTLDYFSGDKWVYVDMGANGVVLGAISDTPIIKAINDFQNGDSLAYNSNEYNYLSVIKPFTWYKNFDAIPKDIKTEFEFSLVMVKTHMGWPSLFPSGQKLDSIDIDTIGATYMTFGTVSSPASAVPDPRIFYMVPM